MKHIVLVIFAALVAGVAAYLGTGKVCTKKKEASEMEWLTKKLSLTQDQALRIREVHHEYCPNLNGLAAKYKAAVEPEERAALKRQCEDSIAHMVEKVCEVLDPVQREGYRELVKSWFPPEIKTNGKPSPHARE